MSERDSRPKPFVPPNLDMRDIPRMPLDIPRMQNSETWAIATGDEAKALMDLWMRAWHQIPAGSLPNDERVLASFVHRSNDVQGWEAIREVVLRGFVECSDGRLYHKTVCEAAMEVHNRLEKYRRAGKASGQKRKTVQRRSNNDQTSFKHRPNDAPASLEHQSNDAAAVKGKGKDSKNPCAAISSEASAYAREGEKQEQQHNRYVEEIVEQFLGLRVHHWGNDAQVNQAAPLMTLRAQVQGFIDRWAMPPNLIREIMEREMKRAADKGKGPSNSFKAMELSMQNAAASYREANGIAPPNGSGEPAKPSRPRSEMIAEHVLGMYRMACEAHDRCEQWNWVQTPLCFMPAEIREANPKVVAALEYELSMREDRRASEDIALHKGLEQLVFPDRYIHNG